MFLPPFFICVCIFGMSFYITSRINKSDISFLIMFRVDVNKPMSHSQGVSGQCITEASEPQRRCLAICGTVPKPKVTSLICILYIMQIYLF